MKTLFHAVGLKEPILLDNMTVTLSNILLGQERIYIQNISRAYRSITDISEVTVYTYQYRIHN